MSEALVASGNNKSAERINRNKRPAAAPIEVADRNALWQGGGAAPLLGESREVREALVASGNNESAERIDRNK